MGAGDGDGEFLEQWYEEHPEFDRKIDEEWYKTEFVDSGQELAIDQLNSCFVFRTKEAAEQFGRTDPVIASGRRNIEQGVYLDLTPWMPHEEFEADLDKFEEAYLEFTERVWGTAALGIFNADHWFVVFPSSSEGQKEMSALISDLSKISGTPTNH